MFDRRRRFRAIEIQRGGRVIGRCTRRSLNQSQRRCTASTRQRSRRMSDKKTRGSVSGKRRSGLVWSRTRRGRKS